MLAPAPENILIQAPTWIGDLVMATASFADLRRAFPGARISILVRPGRDRVIAGGGYFDEAIVDGSKRGWRGFLRTAAELRRRRFDLAVLYSDSLRVAALAALAGIPRRAGYRRNLRGFLLSHGVRHAGPRGAKTPEPMPRRYARLIAALGVSAGSERPILQVTPAEEERARARLAALGVAPGEALVGFNPGASFGSTKIWPPRHFARLGDLIAERYGMRALILVGPGEEPIACAIAAAMRHPPVSTADSLVPLDELKPIIRDLKLLITTDTGPRQYAVAFRVPLVALFGSTDPAYSNANLDETEIVRRRDVPCSPCHLKRCPIDHRCMEWITPEEVLERVEALNQRLNVFGEGMRR
jgi:heptosyltransferase-2